MLVYTIIIVYIQVASTVLVLHNYIEDVTGDACKYRYTLCHTTA